MKARRKSFTRKAHGTGASSAVVRVELPPRDELAAGVAAFSGLDEAAKAQALAAVKRGADGKVADKESARLLGQLGGYAKAAANNIPALARGLGLRDIVAAELKPYLDDALEMAERETDRLARVVGGGVCENAPASLVQSAALQLAGSRYAFARGDLALGSKLANDSRQNLLAAHELAAREAQARSQHEPDELARQQREFQRTLAERQAKPAERRHAAEDPKVIDVSEAAQEGA